MRLDQRLVHQGLAPSRTKAQELIESGAVEIEIDGEWTVVTQASFTRPELDRHPERLRLRPQDLLRYVSRGGLKLESALRHLALHVEGWTCLDCGQSTGGFTDCLLQNGATRVVGFDVGQGQLAARLRDDPRVQSFEELHLKDAISHVALAALIPPMGFDLIVADLSFIPAEKTLPFFAAFGPRLLLLVKPQFEVGRGQLTKKGLVKDADLYGEIRQKITNLAPAHGWKVLDYFASGVDGRDGNREFFLFAERTGTGT